MLFLYIRSEELQLHSRMARISQTINPGQNVRYESHKPVSRQYEEEYYRYYGWPSY